MINANAAAKWVINYLPTELLRYNLKIEDSPVEPSDLAHIIKAVETGEISENGGKKVLKLMMDARIKRRVTNLKMSITSIVFGPLYTF